MLFYVLARIVGHDAESARMESKVTSERPEDSLIDSRRAATVLGISTRKLWSLVQEGKVKVVRIGRAVRFHPADLRAFIDAHRSGSPS